jgi:hypothetical protein
MVKVLMSIRVVLMLMTTRTRTVMLMVLLWRPLLT